MSWDFHFVFVLSFSFKFFIFWVSTAHDQKAHFLTSSVVTRHKNEIWDFKLDKFFNFMCTIFLQSITLSGLILLEESLWEFWFFNWPLEGHVTL